MQVVHGETLLSERFKYRESIDFDQTPDIPLSDSDPLEYFQNSDSDGFISDKFSGGAKRERESPVEGSGTDSDTDVFVVSEGEGEEGEGPDCVSNLLLRKELMEVSSYLQRLAPDRVVLHNDPVDSRLLRRLGEAAETKAFVAFDVEKLIDRRGMLRHLLPELAPAVRANAANHHVLAALVGAMGVRVTVESAADVTLLAHCMQDVSAAEACSNAPVAAAAARADFAGACALHSAVVRSGCSTRAALLAGVSRMAVGSMGGIKAIEAAVRAAPRESRPAMAPPAVVLAIRSAAPQADAASYAAGTSVLKSLLSFAVPGVPGAVAAAHKAGMAVAGVTAEVAALLDGTVAAALLQISLRSPIAGKNSAGLMVVLEDLDAYLAAAGNSNVYRRIRVAMAGLQTPGSAPISLCADVSSYLLGTNQVLLTRVIGARPSIGDDGSVVGRQFYVDDGIYGSLCSRTKATSVTAAFSVGYDKECPLPYIMKQESRLAMDAPVDIGFENLPCTIWGQTCDSLDKVMVAPAGSIPAELSLGDWLSFVVPMCAGNGTNTGFNGYDAPMTRFMVHTGFE
jgi:hypothetical protein